MGFEKTYLIGCFLVLLLAAVLVLVDMVSHMKIEKEIARSVEEARICEWACKEHVNEMRIMTRTIINMFHDAEEREKDDGLKASTE